MTGNRACLFAAGQEVALVDTASGRTVGIVEVADVDAGRGEIRICAYTHRFDLSGRGLDEEVGHYVPGGIVVDMEGRVIGGPGAPRWVPERVRPATCGIRPATDGDRLELSEAEARCSLALALGQRLLDIAGGVGSVSLDALIQAAALIRVGDAGTAERPADRPSDPRRAAGSPALP